MALTDELQDILYQKGAALVGVGNMKGVAGCDHACGVAVAIPIPKHIIRDLQTAPTKEYYDMYYSMNSQLDGIVIAGEEFLRNKGYNAFAQTRGRVRVEDGHVSRLPHKTVAARAGLGWIGKNCLLVTERYGSAVRLSSLLTDAPLECNRPVGESECGSCELCVRACPGQALQGTLWKAGMERQELISVDKCYEKQLEIMFRETGIRQDLCGKCFATCAYTKKYLEGK